MKVKVLALAGLCLLGLALYPHPSFADEAPEDDVPEDDYDGEGDGDDYGGGDDYGSGDDYDDDGGEGGGPPAEELKELISMEDFDSFLDNEDASVVGFFAEEGEPLENFKSVAQGMQYDFRFAYTSSEEILAKYKYKSAVICFKPPRFVHEKYDKPKARFPGSNFSNAEAIKIFAREASLPLVGQITYATRERYDARGYPVVKVFFDVDYELNPKGSNYYANRIRKVAVDYIGRLSFTVAAIKDYSYEAGDYGLELETGKKQVGVGIDDGDKRYGMPKDTEFSVANLKAFVESFLNGELEPTKVVEPYAPPPPSDEDGADADESAVTVLTPDNFDDVVKSGDKNVMVEFYAPWCGHCKMLKPEYAKLGKEFEEDDDVVVAKMDADAHQAPKDFDVQGYPTIFFVPKGGKPVSYDGERNADAMADYIRANKK